MIRIGFGYDVHRFALGRRLIVGGVEIPHSHGLMGRSLWSKKRATAWVISMLQSVPNTLNSIHISTL